MKQKVVVSVFVGLLLFGLAVAFWGRPDAHPGNLSHWLRAARGKDWSSEAAQGKPEAQFFLGLTLIRTNLITMVDRVPLLSRVPLIGKRFERFQYEIDASIAPEQLAESHRWIQKSASQGFPPARETEKLFRGRLTAPNPASPPIQPTADQPKTD